MNHDKDAHDVLLYPERDPKDELQRLITGSPSHPMEIDHFLFRGQRDWNRNTRILVAGGGTGDALIQIAQVLSNAQKPYEIIYLDLSEPSMQIARQRAAARKLTGISFINDSLLNAPSYGKFDYIDCCAVLHQLSDPQRALDVLASVLTRGGGMGLVVNAPYGRSGVYPLQEALGTLLAGLPPSKQLQRARKIVDHVPEGHPFRRNSNLSEHRDSDAGLYDLLLHTQDRPFTIDTLIDVMGRSGLRLAGFPQPFLYDLSRFVAVPDGMGETEQMALAEKLDGTIKSHIVYATKTEHPDADGNTPSLRPHLRGLTGHKLAKQIAKTGEITLSLNGGKYPVPITGSAVPLLELIDGQHSLAEIAALSGLDADAFGSIWRPAHRALTKFGLLLYSDLLA